MDCNWILNLILFFFVLFCFCSLWWPCFVILFYIFSVIPTLIIKRSMQSALFGPSYFDLSIFLTMGFIVCSFGLPIVLARAEVVCLNHHFAHLFLLLLLLLLFCLFTFQSIFNRHLFSSLGISYHAIMFMHRIEFHNIILFHRVSPPFFLSLAFDSDSCMPLLYAVWFPLVILFFFVTFLAFRLVRWVIYNNACELLWIFVFPLFGRYFYSFFFFLVDCLIGWEIYGKRQPNNNTNIFNEQQIHSNINGSEMGKIE